MSTLMIDDFPDELHADLKRQAREHRRSPEAEAVDIIRTGVAPHRAILSADEVQRRFAQLRAAAHAAQRPAGWLVSDEIGAERRLEAAFDQGVITRQEWIDWQIRMDAYEVWPNEVEAFAMQRIRGQA